MERKSFGRRLIESLGLAQDEESRALSPQQLRRRIDTLERQVEALARMLDIDPRRLPQPELVCSPRVVQLAREGQKIQAIKLHREETGAGLREAKEDVESLGY